MYNLGQALWQLTMATQNMDALNDEELFECYKLAYVAHYYSHENGVSETERRWALKLFEDVETEMQQRHLTVLFAFVSMDQQGNFVCGREELKSIFAKLSFEDRLEVADEMLEKCENEQQRLSLIELQRELITEAK